MIFRDKGTEAHVVHHSRVTDMVTEAIASAARSLRMWCLLQHRFLTSSPLLIHDMPRPSFATRNISQSTSQVAKAAGSARSNVSGPPQK